MKADSLCDFKQSYITVKFIFLKVCVVNSFEISEENSIMTHLEAQQRNLLEWKMYMKTQWFYYK